MGSSVMHIGYIKPKLNDLLAIIILCYFTPLKGLKRLSYLLVSKDRTVLRDGL